MTRYVIVGAGAIGGMIGGRLAAAGVPTVLVARGEHGRVLARPPCPISRTGWSSPSRPKGP